MFTIFRTLLLACIVLLATSCSKQNSQLPEQATPLKEVADIYPDYRDIVAPPNIAPLDFMVKNEADEAMAHLVGGGKELIAEADENGTFREPDWVGVTAVPGAKLHIYGKAEARRARKMGHVTIVGRTAEEAMTRAREVARILHLPEPV